MSEQCSDTTGPDSSVCDLSAGHEGDHIATIATGADGRRLIWRWSQMPPLERQVDLTRCGALHPTDPAVLACQLDAGHEGLHLSQRHGPNQMDGWTE